MYRMMLGFGMVAVVVALLAGCGGGGGGDSASTKPYFPVKTSYEWTYDGVDYVGGTAIAAAQGVEGRHHRSLHPADAAKAPLDYTQIWSITGTTQISGATWYNLVIQNVGSIANDPLYRRHTSDALQERESTASDEVPYDLLQLPLETGNSWGYSPVPGVTLTITDADATVTVPAGTFQHCVVVRDVQVTAGQPDDIIIDWYAPNVGMVREEYLVGVTTQYTLELHGYSL
jgi:hypothetical protein